MHENARVNVCLFHVCLLVCVSMFAYPGFHNAHVQDAPRNLLNTVKTVILHVLGRDPI